MTKSAIDISIIVTAHSEGLIGHKTMLSIFKAVEQLGDIKFEIIVSIDNGNPETLEYFRSLQERREIRTLEVSFKDLSASRNNAVKESRGDYITFIDADDLMSSNWLNSALTTAISHPGSIVHPEYSITFGDDNLIWRKRNSGDKTIDTLCMVDNNLWDSPCLAPKEIFEKYPYHPNGNGFGYEDKKFNSDTLADNIKHLVAPETLLFVRRKITGSMLLGAIADKATIAPTPLMSFESIRKLDLSGADVFIHPLKSTARVPVLGAAKHVSKRVLAKVHNKAKGYEPYRKVVRPLREKRQEKILNNLKTLYPDWMIGLWRSVHKIDNGIFPSKELLKNTSWYNAENIIPGYRYAQLVQSFSKRPDTLFFVPHLIKGGADLVFINYANALHSTKGWHISMLQTEATLSVWKEKISDDIDFVDVYEQFKDLDTATQHRLLATLIVQNEIKRIVVGNSQMAYDFISAHATLLSRLNVAIYCFAFGEEFDDEGRLWGHIHTGIPKIYPVLHRIITDNKNTINKLSEEYAFGKDKFRVHYQPTSVSIKPSIQNQNKPLKILWASRVCKQKRPDIVKAVSNKLDSSLFQIDAWGQLEEGLTESYFDDSRITYKGPFNGMSNLPTEDYDIYIYTSEGDGMPNVLQEITAAGLPIIASNVGGIGEFIRTNSTGYLVNDREDIDDYIRAVEIFSDPSLRRKMNNNAQKLLTTQFSKENWLKNIATDFDK